jgi:hypothetical protein
MEEEKTGTEQAGDADQQTGVNLESDGQAEGTQAAAGDQDDKTVEGLKAAAKAEREKRQEAEEAAENLRNQMALQAATQQVQQTQEKPKSTYEQAISDCGIADPEYMTEAERIKVMARYEELNRFQSQQQAQMVTNQAFINAHSDYGEVVGKNNAQGVFMPSAELTKILTEKPYLQAAAYASSQGAYRIVLDERKAQELLKKQKVLDEHLVEQDIDTKTAPLGGSAAGGAGSSTESAVKLDTVEDVAAVEQRVAAGEFDTKG